MNGVIYQKKLRKLMEFRKSNLPILDDTERYLLRQQSDMMDAYIEILDARIAHATLKERMK